MTNPWVNSAVNYLLILHKAKEDSVINAHFEFKGIQGKSWDPLHNSTCLFKGLESLHFTVHPRRIKQH